VNAAALQTVQHGGQAFEVSVAQMPAKGDVVAALRF
jgi:hypothetical protein